MTNAPAPMRVYRETIIDPRNEQRRRMLEERLKRYQPLPARERRRLALRAWLITLSLWLAGWNRRKQREYAAQTRVHTIEDELRALKAIRTAYFWQVVYYLTEPKRVALFPALITMLPALAEPLRNQWSNLLTQRAHALAELERRRPPARLQAKYQQWRDIQERLAANEANAGRLAEERTRRRELEKEVKITAAIIRSEWARLAGCHYVKATKDGKEKIVTPGFDKVWIQSHSITYRVKTSVQGVLGFRGVLPYRVMIKSLYDPDNLETIAMALDRQITAKWNFTRTRLLLRVNRLDAPNAIPDVVPLDKMLEAYPFNDAQLCPFPVGVDENNTAVWLNLHLAPHLLVVGATRGGKTNYLKGVLCSLIQTQTPEDLQLVLIDNKGTEFLSFKDVPHVVGGICDQSEYVIHHVQRVADEIKRRSQLFKESGVTTILDYNELVPEDRRLPRVLMIVDELQPITELPRETREKIYQYFARIGSLGAAAGVHGILCTQYAERTIIRGGIKTHFVYRVAFKMASGSDSMTAIRNHAAFKLPNIRGRAVYTYNPDPIEIQTAFVQDRHMAYAFQQAKQYSQPLPFFEVSREDEDTQEVKVLKERRRLTEEEFIELALSRFNGQLSPTNIHEYLGDESPGRKYLQRILENIRNRHEIEFNGETYNVGRGERTTYVLQLSGAHQTQNHALAS